MNRSLTSLLVLFVAATGFILSENTHDVATAVPYHVRSDLPPGIFVARVYYQNLAELTDLAAYDVWEYNNLEDKYVLVALDGSDFIELEQKGWQMQIDLGETALLSMADQPPFSMGYGTVDEQYEELQQLNSQYPQLTELVKYGESSCSVQGGCTTPGGDISPGYDLLAMRISNENIPAVSELNHAAVSPGDKPVFFLLANIHARELTTPELAMRLIQHLLLNHGENADITWLVDWHEIWIVPFANPDGHWLVELGAEAPYEQGAFYQRKNGNLDANSDGKPDCSAWPPTISRQYGVDLNRNHTFSWSGPGSSTDPCSQTYRGPVSASEPEIAALQTLIQTLIPDQRGSGITDPAPQSTTGLLLTLHSFGDLILWPWADSDAQAPNYAGLKAIGDKLAAFNGYQSCQGSTCLYSASGTTDDWAYGELGIPAFTFEIGRQFMPDYAEIDEVQWPQNLPSFLYAAQIARAPYETILGPDVQAVDAAVSTTEKLVRITAVVDNSNHLPGSVAAASYSIDLPYWAPGVITKPMTAADGAFDDNIEAVTAIVPFTELTPGKHLLYVNGKNSAGHWGVTSASFVTVKADNIINTYIPFNSFIP